MTNKSRDPAVSAAPVYATCPCFSARRLAFSKETNYAFENEHIILKRTLLRAQEFVKPRCVDESIARRNHSQSPCIARKRHIIAADRLELAPRGYCTPANADENTLWRRNENAYFANELHPRHQDILELAKQNSFLSTEELTKVFKVTSQTIRRDINELCEKGLLRRYHGGAGLASSIENVDYSARQVLNHEEKDPHRADGRPADSGQRVTVHQHWNHNRRSGKGALRPQEPARHHQQSERSRPPERHSNFEVVVAGGVVRRDRGVIGESTIDFIKQFKVDFGIIGISGIDQDGTLLDFDYREVRVAQAIIENARQVFLVTDHTKFTRNPMVRLETSRRLTHCSGSPATRRDQGMPGRGKYQALH